MIDIVPRLREHAATSSYLTECRPRGLIYEAADEIERLRLKAKADAREMLEAVERAEVEIERLRAALRSIVQGWDWWADDPYNRCQSVPGDAIEEVRALLEAGR